MSVQSSVGVAPTLDRPYPGAPFRAAVGRYWKKYATFSGRASRSEYWWGYLAAVVPTTVASLVTVTLYFVNVLGEGVRFVMLAVILLAFLYGLATLIPSLSSAVRRLHDTDQSGFMYFLVLIPFVGPIVLLGMLAQPSKVTGARFDLVPPTTVGAGVNPVPPPAPQNARSNAWAQLHDASTSAHRLAEIAEHYPEFAAQIAAHPHCYAELQAWAVAANQGRA